MCVCGGGGFPQVTLGLKSEGSKCPSYGLSLFKHPVTLQRVLRRAVVLGHFLDVCKFCKSSESRDFAWADKSLHPLQITPEIHEEKGNFIARRLSWLMLMYWLARERARMQRCALFSALKGLRHCVAEVSEGWWAGRGGGLLVAKGGWGSPPLPNFALPSSLGGAREQKTHLWKEKKHKNRTTA